MKELIKNTGLSFEPGQKLSSASLNILNDRLNDVINSINTILKSEVNINAEENNFNRVYTIREAISLVPSDRRVSGIKLRFKESDEFWGEYVYLGESKNDESWFNLDNWNFNLNDKTINGGEW